LLPKLCLLNAALLITHEIDSAFWRGWELFGLPAGIQLFLVLNLILVLIMLVGHQRVVRGEPSGRLYSWLMVGGGLFAGCTHGWFFAERTAAIPAGGGTSRRPRRVHPRQD
jgi:hypothetical protein